MLLTKLFDLKCTIFCVDFGEEEFIRLSPMDDDEPKDAEKPPFKAASSYDTLANITFCFIETGTVFIKDSKRYHLPKKSLQSLMAHKSGMNFKGKPIEWHLTDNFGIPINPVYKPYFGENCKSCGSKLICNGCSNCGKCER